MPEWELAETNTHQDHVIAHVIGSTVLAYFIWDETAYLLLDIGFIWNIYLDGEMGLSPQTVALAELDVSDEIKNRIRFDVDHIDAVDDARNAGVSTGMADSRYPVIEAPIGKPQVLSLVRSNVRSPIQTVDFLSRDNSRRLRLICEEGSVVIETALDTAEVSICEE
jgi:hypothetical protein